MKNSKIDLSKLRRVATEEIEGYKPMFPKPKKRLKKDRSKLQVKKDNVRSTYHKKRAMMMWGKVLHAQFDSCLICGRSDGQLQAHHLLSRAKVMTRNDLDNGVILCSYHHLRCPELSPHAGAIGFTEFLRENHPEKIEYVMKNKNKTGKVDYLADYEKLKVIYDNL